EQFTHLKTIEVIRMGGEHLDGVKSGGGCPGTAIGQVPVKNEWTPSRLGNETDGHSRTNHRRVGQGENVGRCGP
ncbi:MAG: hypothetical protein RIS76_1294, partial [Verrucomicrobiota bacterium]